MEKVKCGCCQGTGEETKFSEDEMGRYIGWMRQTSKEFVKAEGIAGKGFVMISPQQMRETYNEWKDSPIVPISTLSPV